MKINEVIAKNKVTFASLDGDHDVRGDDVYIRGTKLNTFDGMPISNELRTLGIDGNAFTSLKGSPQIIHNSFDCSNNKLTTLVGGPKEMYNASYNCDNNALFSLRGAPDVVGLWFSCDSNKLTSFKDGPKVYKMWVSAENNRFTSLKDIHKHIKRLDGALTLLRNPIKSHILGVLLIPGLTKLETDFPEIDRIVNKYIGKGMPGLLQAQEELIDAGFEDYAQL